MEHRINLDAEMTVEFECGGIRRYEAQAAPATTHPRGIRATEVGVAKILVQAHIVGLVGFDTRANLCIYTYAYI